MFSIAHATVVSMVILGLGACASPAITALENAPPPANPFALALSQEYLAFARTEKTEMFDLKDFPYFAEKGLAVATATAQEATPGPVDPGDWSLPAERQRRLHNARNRLASRLSNGADNDAPALAANAQVSFDCWVEQAEEGDQPTHIAACRDQFNSAMARADAPSGPPRAVFFALDSAALDANARKTVTAIAAKAIHLAAPRLTIQGHADQSGTATHNLGLSLRRADAVRAALIGAGFPATRIAVSAAGESRPRTVTPNSAALRENRRVELIFQPYETW
jgi:OmpA-OmpF porin, OOP family